MPVRHSATARSQAARKPVISAAVKTLWQLAYREASTLAYADAFRAIMVAFVIATLMVPLLRNVTVGSASASASH